MDKQYWEKFYQNFATENCSSFAQFCKRYIDEQFKDFTPTIIDIGCGNLRDSKYFSQFYGVIAIDQVDCAIENSSKLLFINNDFTNLSNYYFIPVIYSRFSIHAITKLQQDKTFQWAYNSLANNGLFCIEARTLKDSKFGLGVEVGENEYIYDNHYRRFLNYQETIDDLISVGFKIIFNIQSDNLSIFDNDNPIVLRIICKKEI